MPNVIKPINQIILSKPHISVEASQNKSQYWKDLFNYRELLLILTWRDVSVRYKQTILGVTWALIQPFLTMVVLSVVFGKFAKMPSGDIPYPILVYAGLLPWQFFATSLNNTSNSLISNAQLLSKVYFPRLILPISSVMVAFVDFLISFAIMLGLMFYYDYMPSWRVILLPLILGLVFISASSAGLWFASLNVRFRDFRYIVPFVIQFGLYASPVGFSSSVVPEEWQFYYNLNPMVSIIEGFRWAILGQDFTISPINTGISIFITGLMLYGGICFFRKTERTFADII